MAIQGGSVFAIAPGIPHSYGSDADKLPAIFWFHLSGIEYAAVTVIPKNKDKLAPQAIQSEFWDKRIRLSGQTDEALQNGYSQSNLLAANLTRSCFLASFVLPEIVQRGLLKLNSPPTDKTIGYLQQNLSNTIILDNIAPSANLSDSLFYTTPAMRHRIRQ